jgi:hypothetical protein
MKSTHFIVVDSLFYPLTSGYLLLIYFNKKELEEIIWKKYYLEDC